MSSCPNVAQRITPATSAISRRSIQPASGAGGFSWIRRSGGAKSAGSACIMCVSLSAQLDESILQSRKRPQALRLRAEARRADHLLCSHQTDAAQAAVLAVPVGEIAAERAVVRSGETELPQPAHPGVEHQKHAERDRDHD